MELQFRDIIERAENGPYCAANEWDAKVVPTNLKEVVKAHGLERTYDGDNPINSDDSLADKFFKAGWDMALKTGLYCTSTERVVKITEDELKSMLRVLPNTIRLGVPGSKDEVIIKHRNPEDTYPPNCSGGGCSCSEDIAVPRAVSALQYRVIDGGMAGIPKTFHGMELKAGAPTEYMWGVYFARLTRQIHKRVNRPGLSLPVGGSSLSMMAGMVGEMLKEGVPGSTGIPAISELKFSYDELTRVAMCLHLEIPNKAFHHPMLGGFAGGPENCAVQRIAGSLLLMPIYQTNWTDSCIYDIRYSCNSSRQSVWASSVGCQALARNTNQPHGGYIRPPFPPGTDLLLYAGTVPILSEITSGACHGGGITPVTPDQNYATSLEQKFGCELAKAISKHGFKRSAANEVAKQLLPKYEDKQGTPPKGKTFQECIDLITLKPKPEWLGIYQRVRKELIDLGVPLE